MRTTVPAVDTSITAPAALGALASRRSKVFARIQNLSLPVMFAIFGVIMGSWAGRIPAMAARLNISHSALSMVLLCGGIGALLSFPVSSFLMRRVGARKTMLYSGLALLAVLVAIGIAPTVASVMGAVLMLGITASTYDVAMNAAASKREKATGKSEMSLLHGLACAGGLVGATLGSVMAGMKVAPAIHFMMVAGPMAAVLWAAYQVMDIADEAEQVEKKKFALPRGPMALLGLLGFLGSMSEGSIADWSGVFLKEHFHATDGLAPLALSCFSVMMLASRLVGDKLKTRFGAQRLVTVGACISAMGLFFAVLAPSAHVALGGFAVAGLGLSLLFPFVFSAAGAQGPIALAGVASMAYSGTLMGPPVIGAIASHVGMQMAIGYLGLLSIAIALVASRTKLLK